MEDEAWLGYKCGRGQEGKIRWNVEDSDDFAWHSECSKSRHCEDVSQYRTR